MESIQPAEPAQSLSFLDKLAGVFLSPGEVFENVAQTGQSATTWLVPWLLYVVMAIISGQLLLSNPSLSAQLEQVIKEQFDVALKEDIAKGAVTQEQADAQFEQFGKPGSPLFTLLSTGGIALGSLVSLFAISLFSLLLGKSAMGATAPYMKVVEVVGLSYLIDMLEQAITAGLMFLTDSIHASPGLALFLLPDIDLQDKVHIALSKVNVFTFWKIGILSIGLSKLFRKDFPKVFVLVLALWVLWSIFSIFTGFTTGG
jgi:hypothetical protein